MLLSLNGNKVTRKQTQENEKQKQKKQHKIKLTVLDLAYERNKGGGDR